MGALKEDDLAIFPCLMQGRDDVGDVRAESLDSWGDFLPNLIDGEGGQVVFFQSWVGFVEAYVDELARSRFIEHVSEAQSDAVSFVRVGRAYAAFGGADFVFAESCLAGCIELTVVGQHDVGTVGNE